MLDDNGSRYQKVGRRLSPAAGFTMIEMMIVLTIIAILSTLAMPSFKGVATSTRLKSSAKGIRDLCHFARNMAITEQLGYFVILDMDQNQYWLADIETFNTAFAAADNMLMQPETSTTAQQLNPMNQTVTTQQLTASRTGNLVGTPNDLASQVTFFSLQIMHTVTAVESSSQQEGQNYIYFSPNGTASIAEIVLQGTGNRGVLVTVEYATGRTKFELINVEQEKEDA